MAPDNAPLDHQSAQGAQPKPPEADAPALMVAPAAEHQVCWIQISFIIHRRFSLPPAAPTDKPIGVGFRGSVQTGSALASRWLLSA